MPGLPNRATLRDLGASLGGHRSMRRDHSYVTVSLWAGKQPLELAQRLEAALREARRRALHLRLDDGGAASRRTGSGKTRADQRQIGAAPAIVRMGYRVPQIHHAGRLNAHDGAADRLALQKGDERLRVLLPR